MAVDIKKFNLASGCNFKNKQLLTEALTHRSYATERKLPYDNQRLEFLGDAVLEIILSEYLYKHYPQCAEGELTKMRAVLARKETLALAAARINIGGFLLMGRGEIDNRGNERDSTLSDLFEALLGALYLDSGLGAARDFLLSVFADELAKVPEVLEEMNPKGTLQEFSQKNWNITPEYEVMAVNGPDHQPQYVVEVRISGKVCCRGISGSRKGAEIEAAKQALEIIHQKNL